MSDGLLVILDEREPNQILIAASPSLETIDLGYGRSVTRLQLDAVILHSWRVKDELFITARPVCGCITHADALVDAAIPDVYHVFTRRHRIAF